MVTPRDALRAVALIRMSTAKQVNSPARQRELFAEYCERHGLLGVAEYDDLATSATHVRLEDRGGIMRMLTDAVHGRFDIVWCEEQSRASRDPLEIIPIQRHLATLGIALVDHTEDPHEAKLTAERELLTTVRAALSRYEVRQLGARVRRAQILILQRGEYQGGKLPAGIAWDGTEKRFVEDPGTVGLVRRAFHLFVETRSCQRTAKRLNEEGYVGKHGGVLAHTTVSKILLNPVYRGRRRSLGSCWDAELPVIVDPAVVAEADRLLSLQVGRPQRTTRGPALFTGLLRCPECAGFLSPQYPDRPAGSTGEKTTYRCSRGHGISARCQWRRCLGERVLVGALLPKLAAGLRAIASRLRAPSSQRIARFEPQAAQATLQEARNRAVQLYVSGKISGQELDGQLAVLDTQLKALAETETPPAHSTSAHDLQQFAETLEQHWTDLSLNEQRDLLQSLVSAIIPDVGNLADSRIEWKLQGPTAD